MSDLTVATLGLSHVILTRSGRVDIMILSSDLLLGECILSIASQGSTPEKLVALWIGMEQV